MIFEANELKQVCPWHVEVESGSLQGKLKLSKCNLTFRNLEVQDILWGSNF